MMCVMRGRSRSGSRGSGSTGSRKVPTYVVASCYTLPAASLHCLVRGLHCEAVCTAAECVRMCACVCACMCVCVHACLIIEEEMYAQLWREDMLAKAKREEMEAVLQIERNREMLKVGVWSLVLV